MQQVLVSMEAGPRTLQAFLSSLWKRFAWRRTKKMLLMTFSASIIQMPWWKSFHLLITHKGTSHLIVQLVRRHPKSTFMVVATVMIFVLLVQ